MASAQAGSLSHSLKFLPYVAAVGAFFFLSGFLFAIRKLIAGGICTVRADLSGKVVVITGANAGIGKQAALALARMDATLVLACRTRKTAEETRDEIKKSTGNEKITLIDLDLASFDSVRKCAAAISQQNSKIDILINNAGLMDVPFTKTVDGFELQFEAASRARIINVASNSHIFTRGIDYEQAEGKSAANYGRRSAYSQSKLANILFTAELGRQLKASGSPITTYTLHPGLVDTEILRHWPAWLRLLVTPVMRFIAKTPEQGAQTTIYTAIAPGIEATSGAYYSDCKVHGRNASAAVALFSNSERYIGTLFFSAQKKMN